MKGGRKTKGGPVVRRWGWRRIHKWLAIVAGLFLLAWIVTGIFISTPLTPRPALQSAGPAPDFSRATLSPADALTAAAQMSSERATAVRLGALGDRPIYYVDVPGMGRVTLDAATGERIEIDADAALRLATSAYSGDGTPGEPERLERRNLWYLQGDLPAYRIRFDDAYGTEVHVAIGTGMLNWQDGRVRWRRLMAAGHDLWPVGFVIGPWGRASILLFGSFLALAATLTGYWLAVRRVKRARP